MKKVLFATTALVMTAGVATAEVALSGSGRMGMIYDGDDVQFSSRARVVFTLTGESDAGLSFGGEFRADQAQNSNASGTAGAVWVSGTYGRLSMGDTVSASEAAIGDLYAVGYTEGGFAGDLEEISYLTGDRGGDGQGPNILYEYTVNNISFYASASDGSDTDWFTTTGTNIDDDLDTVADDVAFALAVKYDGGNWNAGLAYSKWGDMKEIALGGEAKFNNFSVKGVYVKYDDTPFATLVARAGLEDAPDGVLEKFGIDGDDAIIAALGEQKYTAGLAAAYQMDAIRVAGFWRQDKADLDGFGSAKFNTVGIGADYDLGGGAVLSGGIVDTDYLDDTVADFGVRFSF